MDNILVMFKKKDDVQKFLRYISSRHRNIKCSWEEKKEKTLFLEIFISRNNNALGTSIFHKPTFSGTYTNFNSFLPTEYKRALLHTLLYRTDNVHSSYLIHKEINHLKSVWQKNSFPLFFIDNCIHKFLNKLFIKRVRDSIIAQKKEITISLEYLGKISLLIKKHFTYVFRSCHKGIKLNVVSKTSNWLRNAFRFKDQLRKCINSKVLYKYKCDICNKVYIGKAKHHLIVCQYECLGESIATDKPQSYSDKNTTAIRKHYHSLDHLASIDNFSIFGNVMNNYHLSLKESLWFLNWKHD